MAQKEHKPKIVKRPAKGECIDASMRSLMNKQLGFQGEQIAAHALKEQRGLKAVINGAHKAPLDVLTARNGYEVKTMNLSTMKYTKKGIYNMQMKVSPTQRASKLAQAKALKKRPGAIVVVIDDVTGKGGAEVFIKDGVGGFRISTMERLATYERNWKKSIKYKPRARFYKAKFHLEE